MRGSRLLKRAPKLPKFIVPASAVTDSMIHGSTFVLPRYQVFTEELASDCTSCGDASARVISGAFGLETSRPGLHPAPSRMVAAPTTVPSFLRLCMYVVLRIRWMIRSLP